MIPFDVATTFFLAALVMAVAPGPDNIFVLTQSALYGARAGFVSIFGLLTGIFAHIAAVAFGVAALFKASPTAFTGLKIIGAAYLLYLAWLSFRSGAARTFGAESHFPGYPAIYRRGMFMSATNPKVTLFFLAFLPQFADPARGSLPMQIILLGFLFQLAAFLFFSLVALLGGELAKRFNESPRAQILLNRLAGFVFVGLALALAFSHS